MKNTVLKTLTSIILVLSFATVESKAIGDRELGALMGIGGLIIFNNIVNHDSRDYNRNQPIHVMPRYERTHQPIIIYERAPSYRTYKNKHREDYRRNNHRKRSDYRNHYRR